MATAFQLDGLGTPPRLGRKPATSTLLALSLVLLLTTCWLIADYPALSLGRLPDTDDVMRLAQVRDWLAGQAFDDLSQHRLGLEGGAPMHWSRVADIGPALILLLLTPLFRAEGAEFGMAVLYPALLFFTYLLLLVGIARRLIDEKAASVAVVLGALAFPTVSLFIPGRIDHHGLQIVLCVALLRTIVAAPSGRAGLAGGAAAAVSLTVGLETAPEIVAAIAGLGLLWLRGGRAESARLGGFAAALGGATLALLLLRPQYWPEAWCDGFTPASVRAILVASASMGLLAMAGSRTASLKSRLALGGGIGAVAILLAGQTSGVCFTGPYGPVDPYLQRVWLGNVGEASGLFDQQNDPLSLAYGGLCLAGLALSLYLFVTRPQLRERWLGFIVFLAISVCAAVLQIRVTYIMAGVAALPFAAAILMLRERQGATAQAALVLAWIAGTGFSYNGWGMIRGLVSDQSDSFAAATQRCTGGEGLRALAALPAGTVMAPLDSGAYVVGMTPHRSIAGPYHRNNAGNMAAYRFFLSTPDKARMMVEGWGIDYVALCPSSFRELGLVTSAPASLAATLLGGRSPAWLEPVAMPGALAVFKVRGS